MGQSPLHLAACYENRDIVDLLISKGAFVNSLSKMSYTPLHKACSNNVVQNISLLIRKGADVNAEDPNGQTPVSFLQEENDNYDECVIEMVKEFSKLTFKGSVVSKKNMDFVRASPMAEEHFENCKRELQLMADTKFRADYSYFCLLDKKMNLKKLAQLTKNEEFVTKFEKGLPNFSYYVEDLQEVWKDASRVKDEMDAVYEILKSVFKEFLPEIVLRKLTNNLKLEDLSPMKDLV